MYFYIVHHAATFIYSFNQATVLLEKSRISIGPALKKSGISVVKYSIMISNNIDGWGASPKHKFPHSSLSNR